ADPVGPPIDGHEVHQFRVGGGDAAGTAATGFAVVTTQALQGHQVGGADLDSIGPQGDGLGHVEGAADAAGGNQGHLLPNALGLEELVHLGNGVFHRHGDVLLGNIRRGPGAAIAAVQLDHVGAGVIAPHRHHVHVGGGGNLNRHQGPGIDLLDPVDVLLVVFHRI